VEPLINLLHRSLNTFLDDFCEAAAGLFVIAVGQEAVVHFVENGLVILKGQVGDGGINHQHHHVQD
jgi:hypothetical protein